jgi:hypothetical protein
VFIVPVILLNVVVAVLIEEFIKFIVQEKEDEERLKETENEKKCIVGYLDPLMKTLVIFEDTEDLMKKKETTLGIHRTPVYFHLISDNGQLLSVDDEFNHQQSRKMMMGELHRYTHRTLRNDMVFSNNHSFHTTIMLIKFLEQSIFTTSQNQLEKLTERWKRLQKSKIRQKKMTECRSMSMKI